MTKTILIDGKEVAFKASAAVPRIYRMKFGRDIFKDMAKMSEEFERNEKKKKEMGTSGKEFESTMPVESLEMFENIAYIMAKHADPSITKDIMEWLDGFQTFSIYQILPEIVSLWGINMETQVESKKKQSRAAVK